jgi:predicted RNA-binding Zn ribbon-like protein
MTDDPALELLSSDRPGGPDLLEDPEWAQRALERWGVPPSAAASGDDLGELKALRSLLRRIAHSVAAGQAPAGADVGELNAQLGRTPVRAQLEVLGPGRFLVDMRPVAAGWLELALRELAGSFVALLRRSTPPRVKVCANPECRTVFLDESRNRSRRWCASTGCGNRLRVRRHRERRRAAAPG